MLLEEIVPDFHHRERHTLRVAAPTEGVLAAAETVTFNDLPLFRTLATVSSFGRASPQGGVPFVEKMTSGGFRVLSRGPDELVIGSVAPIRKGGTALTLDPDPLASFLSADASGHYRVAFNFHHANDLLTTETRVWVTDERSVRSFTRYWRLIRLPSGLIRREWLRAIRTQALSAAR